MPPPRLSIDPGKADPKGFFANSVLQLQENPIEMSRLIAKETFRVLKEFFRARSGPAPRRQKRAPPVRRKCRHLRQHLLGNFSPGRSPVMAMSISRPT